MPVLESSIEAALPESGSVKIVYVTNMRRRIKIICIVNVSELVRRPIEGASSAI